MAESNNESEIFLWSSFKNGNAESFVTIFKIYYPDLFNYGCKISSNATLVEDCIQDLFIDLWRSNGKAEIVSLRAYLFTAFKFKLIRLVTKAGKTDDFDTSRHEPDFEISREILLINKERDEELKQKVFNAIECLTARQREIIYLRFYQNLGYEEISKIMAISYQAARNLVFQAIKALKKTITFLFLMSPFFNIIT